MNRVLRLKDIAVGEDGDGHGLLYRPDIVPVGPAGVHLHLGAAVDRHGGHTGGLHGLGELHAVDGALVPAQPEFDGDGPSARPPDDRLGHLHRQLGVPHQAGAIPGVGHLGHRTAHIDIQNVRPRLLRGDARRLLHAVRVAAEELHRRRVLPLAQLQQGKGFFVLIAQGLGADHLRHGVPRPQLPAHRPEA